jgi:hypothetical protein
MANRKKQPKLNMNALAVRNAYSEELSRIMREHRGGRGGVWINPAEKRLRTRSASKSYAIRNGGW